MTRPLGRGIPRTRLYGGSRVAVGRWEINVRPRGRPAAGGSRALETLQADRFRIARNIRPQAPRQYRIALMNQVKRFERIGRAARQPPCQRIRREWPPGHRCPLPVPSSQASRATVRAPYNAAFPAACLFASRRGPRVGGRGPVWPSRSRQFSGSLLVRKKSASARRQATACPRFFPRSVLIVWQT